MLIGGHFYKHSGYGRESSWLATDDPKKYLLKQEDLVDEDREGWIYKFFTGALAADFPHIVLEIPWIKDDDMRQNHRPIAIKGSQSPLAFFLPESKSTLSDVLYICEIPWDLFPQGGWDELLFRHTILKNMNIRKKKSNDKKREANKSLFLINQILEKIE